MQDKYIETSYCKPSPRSVRSFLSCSAHCRSPFGARGTGINLPPLLQWLGDWASWVLTGPARCSGLLNRIIDVSSYFSFFFLFFTNVIRCSRSRCFPFFSIFVWYIFFCIVGIRFSPYLIYGNYRPGCRTWVKRARTSWKIIFEK